MKMHISGSGPWTMCVEGIAFKLVVTGIDLSSIAQLAIKYKYLISAKTQLFNTAVRP